MKFMVLWNMKEGITADKITEAIRRRAEFNFPEGVELVEEYWTPRERPASVSIVETNDASALMAGSIYWSDYFSVDVFPVEQWQEALKKLAQQGGK